ncbi:DEAD/DEAH box helicase [Candidatus Woesearchaeota archaeon]|nr:DEAD/DEAH box helicase [Candidatus Woesearchaeota archaeon]
MSFDHLGMSEPLLRAIKEAGFTEPSTIQKKAIPLITQGRDIVAGSATGSGKTLAFGAGIIDHIERGRGIQALIMTPTRELAEQNAKELDRFSVHAPMKTVLVFGGVSINPQIQHLPTADVVVGTPGRLLDHLMRGTIDLSKVKVLVLDEADRMLDMGFIDDVKKIISQCGKDRQTMLFSATIFDEITEIAREYMRDPVQVHGEPMVDPAKLRQVYYDVLENERFSLLVHLLQHESANLVMVFCNSRQNVDFVVTNLQRNGIEAQAIHGGFSQDKRSKALETFHGGKTQVLVATDVAARGLDIKGVTHIYNYDIPDEDKLYIHRIGRTARAGEEGIAVNILSPKDHDNFYRILRYRGIEIEKAPKPDFRKVMVRRVYLEHDVPRRDGGFGARRGGFGGRSGGFRGERRGPPRDRGSGGGFRDGPRRGGGFGQRRGGFGGRGGGRPPRRN